jgi:hypothetical protein
MTANKYRLTYSQIGNYVNIPIEIDFDMAGRENLIEEFENEVVEKVINPIEDFEVTRFAHQKWDLNSQSGTDINYKFNFFDRSLNITATTIANNSNWVSDYNFTNNPTYSGISFTDKEIYYYVNSFKRSFFKLDLYDTPNTETQQLYLTIIIPTQQGLTKQVNIGGTVPNLVNIKKPQYVLDYVGDKEGFFIYWLKNQNYLNISEFYMSAKFFNAKFGQFVRLTNRPQSAIPNKFNFNPRDYFYYKVNLNYSNHEYNITNVDGTIRYGQDNNPINWFEYVNP